VSLAAGQTLTHYEILGPLGAGAMGEVYRARDTRLEREVALKVLPKELAGDEERLRRFEREAKTLASLNHPNVAQVFGIDQVGDACFMAMELVPGEDLAARLSRGALPLDEALDVCRQIAEGVEAAHEAGVIHRDLKPANVVITPDGRVKVLDFGLAKPSGVGPAGSSVADSVLSTEEGRLLGTPTYMAPEQARGRPIDKRVDVWAFGCVMYECLTGKRAFEGAALGDVLAAVLNDEPDWAALPSGTPAHVRRLLERCLRKDSRARLRDVGEARVLLAGDETAPASPSSVRLAWPVVAALALVATGGGVALSAYLGSRSTELRNPFQSPKRIKKLIDWPGTEFDAAISRDGNLFAFVSDRDGQLDAWVGQIDRGMPRNLTNGERSFWALKVRDIYFDLDAANVCLVGEKNDSPTRIDVMSSVRRVSQLGKAVVNPVWSPDGTQVAFHLDVEGDPLYMGDADGRNRVAIAKLEEGMHQHYPAWSTDGRWIYVSRGLPATNMDLWRVRSDGAVEEQLTTDKRDVAYPTPIDDDTVVFVAHEADGGGPWLWVLDVESGRCERAIQGVERYLSIAASLDGKRFVATVANPTPHLRSVPILEDRVALTSDVEPVEGLEEEYASGPRFGGDGSLYFLSSGGIRRLGDERSDSVLPASEAAGLVPPAVSHDGELLAVVSMKRGRPELTVVSAEGVVGETLSDDVDVRGAPCWSPEGDWIAMGGEDEDGEGLFKFRFPPDGTPPVRIADGHTLNPVWSPRGDVIVYAGPQESAFYPVLAVTPDGAPFELPEIQVIRLNERMRFLPDGSGLVYMAGLHAAQDFWLLDMDSLESRQLTRFEGAALVGEMRTFDVAPEGDRIVFDQLRLNSDIVLIELDR
jgi:serine/threonine protein kinase